MPRFPLLTSVIALLVFVAVAAAQDAPKKRPLTWADSDIWNTTTGVTLSPDGKFVAYTLGVPNADGQFTVRNIPAGGEHKVAVGGRPAPTPGAAPTPDEDDDQVAPPTAPVTLGVGPQGGLSGGPVFTPDSRFVYFPLAPTKAVLDKAKADKVKPEDTPRPVLAVMDLATGQVVQKYEKVKSFAIVGDGAGVLLMVKEPKPEEKKPDDKKPDAPPAGEKKDDAEQGSCLLPPLRRGGRGGSSLENTPPAPPSQGGEKIGNDADQRGTRQPGAGGTPPPSPQSTTGTDLVVRNLADGKEATFADVAEYSVSRDVKTLAYTVAAKKPEANGVYVAALTAPDSAAPLKVGVGRYYKLTWNAEQSQLAFFADENPVAPPPLPTADPTNPTPLPVPDVQTISRKPRVYLWDRAATVQVASATPPMAAGLSGLAFAVPPKVAAAVEVLGPTVPGLKAGWQIVDRGGLSFSADGKKLLVSAAPIPVVPPPAAPPSPAPGMPPAARGTGRDPNRFDMDLWHWKDEAIQPMQKVRAAADRTRSYRAVYFTDSRQFRHLADEDRGVNVPAFGDWGIGSSDKKYRGQTWNSPSPSDYALVNVRTGDSRPMVANLGYPVFASPSVKSVAWFDGTDWFAQTVPDGKPVNLTAKLGTKFFDEQHDKPSTPPSHGFTGWATDDASVYVNDRCDIWKLAIDGSSAVNLMQAGRPADVRLRLVRVEKPEDDREPPIDRGLDATKPWLLAAENLLTRDTGFYRLVPGKPPALLLMGARKYGVPTKAKRGDTHLLTVQTFHDFPDYFAAGSDFHEVKRITDVNPGAKAFNWGRAELVAYKTADGKPLQAMLVKPDDFDPAKKYPMIVYIYERLTDTLHTYRPPTVTRGQVINPTYYASNGYLVLMPDIAYRTGQPGASAVKCVLPAIQAVADKGFVDEKAIGINGQSWGGYQIAYLVTQTDRFKAAVAGAPVANMTSAYDGVRWGSGLPRQFQYEKDQSRIGETLWQAPLKYLENSPVFQADRVTTPLLMIANDADDAVPWYQGVEYFLALRRLGKEAYLCNYNGQPHNLTNKAAARDFAVRTQQFYDHHLKGGPMPDWMAKGVPYLDRDAEKDPWKKLFEAEKK